jgi:hypothetical protein
MKISRPDQVGHCTACLTGEYPEIPGDLDWWKFWIFYNGFFTY